MGLNWQVGRYAHALGQGFTTNLACPIGSDPTYDWTYTTFAWAFHQLTVGDGLVWDACAAQKEDLAGNGYRNPPSSWLLFGYWQTPAGQMTRGLVASPRPSTPLLVFGPYVPDVQ